MEKAVGPLWQGPHRVGLLWHVLQSPIPHFHLAGSVTGMAVLTVTLRVSHAHGDRGLTSESLCLI